MAENEIEKSVRELKARLSEYLRRVREGAVVVVTDHGRPVVRIVPVASTREQRVADLLASGIAAWSGDALVARTPVADRLGSRDVADLLLEDRD